MALTPKRITLLTTAAPVVIEMVRKYWPVIEQKIKENPELLHSIQDQLKKLATARKAGFTPDALRDRLAILREQVAYLRAPADDDGEALRATVFQKQIENREASIRTAEAASGRHREKDLRMISEKVDALTEKVVTAFIDEKSQDSYPQ